jgi:hypothetical protein
MRVMAAGLAPGTAAAIVVLVAAAGIAAYSLVDLIRAEQVRYLEKPWWALIICVTIPWGGLAYLIFGKVR